MAYLIINAGSSSMKLSIFNQEDVATSAANIEPPPAPVWKAHVDGLTADSNLTIERQGGQPEKSKFDAAADDFISPLIDRALATHLLHGQIDAVGHRVVHGGNKYSKSVLLDDQIIEDLHGLKALDPVHMAAAIKGIEKARKALPQVRHIAVFDTAFHHDMPAASQIYPVPYSWFADLGIRRFGFHGINHQFCTQRARTLLQGSRASVNNQQRIITCHLGSGASLCATLNGRSLMTTMGYTPLEGLVMGTRCGSIDPGLVLYMVQSGQYSAAELNKVLNEESGLMGISGISGDMRKIEDHLADDKDELKNRAQLAFDIYKQNLAAAIASLVPVLGGLDALVFTGGIGENSSLVRSSTCKSLAFLGITVNDQANGSGESGKIKEERDISSADAAVKTYVIPAGEDITIAQALLPQK